jgi:cullin 3
LAKRLLSNQSVSDDAERGMLQKLKLECGASFVAKLEGMLKDVTASEDLNKSYKAYLQNLGSDRESSTDLSVKVCTASFWPTHPNVPCNLPPELVKITKSFERFFNTKHTGRRLDWHPEHGSVDVKVRFDKGVKEINLSTHGYIVLNAFAEVAKTESLSYDVSFVLLDSNEIVQNADHAACPIQHLAEATGLSEANLKRTLQSLACAKYKILKKEPFLRNILPTDKFMFNHAFTAPQVRLKIQTIASRVETVEEAKETDSRVEMERAQVIEAAIVRTMKSRKQSSTNDLMNEVTAQLTRRFTPKVMAIKLALEKLIEKDYLERDVSDKKMLRYLVSCSLLFMHSR